MGKCESTHKKNDLNPEYNETFTFEVESVKNMVLHVGVWDDDIGFDDKLGGCEIKLDEMDLSPEPRGVDRYVKFTTLKKLMDCELAHLLMQSPVIWI